MERDRALPDFLLSAAAELKIELSENATQQFLLYLNELKRWSHTINLTSIADEKEIIVKHFLDSVMASKVIESKSQPVVLDVGSGAGFPGIPLRIVRDDLKIVLVEPNKKKVAFLRHILGLLQLSHVTVIPDTFQAFCTSRMQENQIDCIVSRALNVEEILSNCPCLLKAANGRVILYRTKPFTDEFPSGLFIDRQISYQLPSGFGTRVLSVLRTTASIPSNRECSTWNRAEAY